MATLPEPTVHPSAPVALRARFSLSRWLEKHIAFILILPTLLGIVIVNLYPLSYAFWLSLQENRLGIATGRFVGLQNYQRLLGDPEIWNSIRVSLTFTIVSVFGAFVIGLFLAILLNRPLHGRGLIRSLFIIPWAIPAFVAALIWAWMYNDQFGILSATLKDLGFARPPVWLDRDHALWSLIAVMIWKSFPFQMITLLAGMQAIPDELYDAAAVDGATRWQQFTAITLPLLRPIAGVSLLLASINAFHYFPIPWILTRGGPSKATNVLPIEAYNIAFSAGDLGYGAAGAVFMFFFILVGSAVYIWMYIKELRTYER